MNTVDFLSDLGTFQSSITGVTRNQDRSINVSFSGGVSNMHVPAGLLTDRLYDHIQESLAGTHNHYFCVPNPEPNMFRQMPQNESGED